MSTSHSVIDLAALAPDYIRSIAPYQPGKPISDVARELGMQETDIVKLASNENPLGASPKALAAIQSSLGELAMYPDGGGFALKAAISKNIRSRQNKSFSAMAPTTSSNWRRALS